MCCNGSSIAGRLTASKELTSKDGAKGHGRYKWNETEWFDGIYRSDVPDSPGTAQIAGELFTGQWHRGCSKQGHRVVAIGIPRRSCEENEY